MSGTKEQRLVEDGFAEAAGIITWDFDSAMSIIAPTLNVMGSHRSMLAHVLAALSYLLWQEK